MAGILQFLLRLPIKLARPFFRIFRKLLIVEITCSRRRRRDIEIYRFRSLARFRRRRNVVFSSVS